MNADDLYQKMKAAWDYLGVGFHGRELVSVRIEGAFLIMEYNGDEVRIKV